MLTTLLNCIEEVFVAKDGQYIALWMYVNGDNVVRGW